MMLDDVLKAGSDDHTVFGGDFTGGYYLQQGPEEFAQLVSYLFSYYMGLGKYPKSYLAVGIAAGGSERFLCEKLDIPSLTIIDDGEHPHHNIWNERNKPALKDRGVMVSEHIGNSQVDSARLFLKSLKTKFDFASIDADHFNDGPRRDFELVKHFLNPGALVWFHDVNLDNFDVKKTFADLSKDYKVQLHTKGRCGIGVVQV